MCVSVIYEREHVSINHKLSTDREKYKQQQQQLSAYATARRLSISPPHFGGYARTAPINRQKKPAGCRRISNQRPVRYSAYIRKRRRRQMRQPQEFGPTQNIYVRVSPPWDITTLKQCVVRRPPLHSPLLFSHKLVISCNCLSQSVCLPSFLPVPAVVAASVVAACGSLHHPSRPTNP